MSDPSDMRISDEDLHAFIDGELSPARAAEIAAARKIGAGRFLAFAVIAEIILDESAQRRSEAPIGAGEGRPPIGQ